MNECLQGVGLVERVDEDGVVQSDDGRRVLRDVWAADRHLSVQLKKLIVKS